MPNIRKKGTVIIKELLGNLGTYMVECRVST